VAPGLVRSDGADEWGVFCPLRDHGWFVGSTYLTTVFPPHRDPAAYWLACMVTHYRHRHRRSYDRWVGWASRNGRDDTMKHTVNEQAKRQLLRLALPFLRRNGVRSDHFAALQGTTDETMVLAVRLLGPVTKTVIRADGPPAPRSRLVAPSPLRSRQLLLPGFEG